MSPDMLHDPVTNPEVRLNPNHGGISMMAAMSRGAVRFQCKQHSRRGRELKGLRWNACPEGCRGGRPAYALFMRTVPLRECRVISTLPGPSAD